MTDFTEKDNDVILAAADLYKAVKNQGTAYAYEVRNEFLALETALWEVGQFV